MTNIAHKNHYVCQALLRRWSNDGVNIWAYATLVSHQDVRRWRPRAISGIAYEYDLYTSSEAGKEELDEFERWINETYEQPALEPIDRLVRGCRVSAADWDAIIRFVAAQDVRTPSSFLEFKKLYDENAPKIVDQLVEEFLRARTSGLQLPKSEVPPPGFAEALRLRIEASPEPGLAALEVGVASRRLWLASQRHILSRCAAILCDGRWSVVTPENDQEWPLTDHPVLRLNWYGPDHYDFGGGWGNKGSEIMMPISPRHLLYMKVRTRSESRLTFSASQTRLVQRLLVERAHRWIFARDTQDWIVEARPRTVDASLFCAERSAWAQWGEVQLEAEGRIGER